jgi:hypothetical protein
MESKAITPPVAPAGTQPNAPPARRKRRSTNGEDPGVRYFLLKPGSSLDRPELGEEVTSIKQVLIRSFKTTQPFLTLMAWNAVEDVSDESRDSPLIVKKGVPRP